ncbi:inactive pancreatic lipase-related protein 1-like [Topomyia yanbarensis]|uniref:inactive pancreatic lipase-related protein 1-like n=1 Tax=Topomyia yanbarensis TaxID=2498891 RepID=UPI00273C1C83|nr:inactive pancreatic lipase-related protein 1-like [Topomyia yanbarensis]
MKCWSSIQLLMTFGVFHVVLQYPNGIQVNAFKPYKQVKFYLYTPKNPTTPQRLKFNHQNTVEHSNFDSSLPTRFIIHGYLSDGNADINIKIRSQYLKRGDFNVIVVDWGAGSKHAYPVVRSRVKSVGKVISKMIDTLVRVVQLSLNNFSLIGHSLGAHIAGVVGKLQNGHIGTIIGMDPAGPGFLFGNSDTLNANCAEYVEAIHTSSVFGHPDILGDADFFVNGGEYQPGCLLPAYCSHMRVIDLFTESITSRKGFWGRRYRLLDHMRARSSPVGAAARMGGEPSNQGLGVRGIFHVETRSSSPFALGKAKS